ncbi:MAG TPA: hypothetical protein VM123_11620 [archaeon]|nr:hypothetical protein [archaeon]
MPDRIITYRPGDDFPARLRDKATQAKMITAKYNPTVCGPLFWYPGFCRF